MKKIMNQNTHQNYFKVALEAIFKSCFVSEKLRLNLKEREKMIKVDLTPVTIADLAVQLVITEHLYQNLPDDSKLLAEEDFTNVPEKFLNFLIEEANRLLPVEKCNVRNFPSSGSKNRTINDVLEVFHSTKYGGEYLKAKEEVTNTHNTDNTTNTHNIYKTSNYWVLDPIDGTKGFIRGDQYAIALAFISNGEPVIGILGCPNLPHSLKEGSNSSDNRGCIFYALKGQGSRMIKLDKSIFEGESYTEVDIAERGEDILISSEKLEEKNFSSLKLAESFEASHSNHSFASNIMKKMGTSSEPIKMDSQAKYGLVARGDCHVILRFPKEGYKECVWDHCAGSIIIKEAGGYVTHADGKELNFDGTAKLRNITGIVVSARQEIHHKLLKNIESLK